MSRTYEYDTSYCQKVIDLGDNGYTVHEIAKELRVSFMTLYRWAEAFHEFADAMDMAKDYYIAYLARVGRENLKNKKFNSRTHELMWTGATYYVSYRALKKSIKNTKNPHEQCYLILDSLMDGVIDPVRAEAMISTITSTHQLIDLKDMKNEFDRIKALTTGVAKDGFSSPAPAVSQPA